MDFHISLRSETDTVRIVVRGELDIATAPELEAVAAGREVGGAPSVLLDLSDVTFIDSTGLRAILLLAQAIGDPLRIVPCRRVEPMRVFDIAGVSARLRFADPG